MTPPNGVAAGPSQARTREPGDGRRAITQVAAVFAAAMGVDVVVRHAWAAMHGAPATGPIDLLVSVLVAVAVAAMHVLVTAAHDIDPHPTTAGARTRWLRRGIAGITVGTCAFAIGALTSTLLQHRATDVQPLLPRLVSAATVGAASALAAAWFATAAQFAARARSGGPLLASPRNALATLVVIASALVSMLPWLMALNAEESARDDSALEAIGAGLHAQDEQLGRLLATPATHLPDPALLAGIQRRQQHLDALAAAFAAQHHIDPDWRQQWAGGERLVQASAGFSRATHSLAQPPTTITGRSRAVTRPTAAIAGANARLRDAARTYRLATQRAGSVSQRMLVQAREDLATYRRWRAISAPAIGFLLTLGFA